ncbi:MAG TPA: hypothetical protein VNO54_06705 [Streptosporangiaceae bacterium]|nr:hypothetical protein [Streptosporangiaceae bacterium]
MTVYSFRCGHTGRDSETILKAKAVAFIRVAELRGAIVETATVNCPDCKR